MGALDGLSVLVKDRTAQIYSWPIIICTLDANGNPVPVSPSGGGIPLTPPTWVRHSALLSASAQVIPAGAIYQYSVLTGTAGDGTMTGLPAGYSDSSQTAIATGFTITAAAASTVAVVWFTAA